MIDWCEKCEEMMQPFLDGVAVGRRGARKRSGTSSSATGARSATASRAARHYVRVAAAEPMSAELKAKLAALRTPLH